jgi:diguanylate cyclase (GGDEF)-like protein
MGAPTLLAAEHRPIRFDRIASEQGLSQTTVVAIHQDRQGYIWLGTEDGLNRYDGLGMTVYKHDPRDPTSLPHDAVLGLGEDADGNLWVATEGGGVARLDRATDRFVRHRHDADDPDSLASNHVRTLRVDSRGQVWIGLRESGLDRLDPSTGRITHYAHDPADPTSLSDDRVYALFEDRSSAIWVGTNGGLTRIDPDTGEGERFVHDPDEPASLSDDRVRAVFEDGAGVLWVGTLGGGLNRLDRATGDFTRYRRDPEDPSSLGDDRVRAVLQDRVGRLWVGTSGGLNLMDDEGRFARFPHDVADPTSLGDDHVMSLLEDRGGVLWVGTRSSGVHKWDPLTWQFGHRRRLPSGGDGLSGDNVTAFAEDRAGHLWVGSFGGGVDVLDRRGGALRHFRHDPDDPGSLSSDRVTMIRRDRAGTMWVGTVDGGVNRIDPESGALTVFRNDPERPDSLAADGIMELFEDRQGRMWVGTFGGGLDRFEPSTGTFQHLRHDPDDPSSLSGNRVTVLAETPGGRLWVGTDGAGLNLLDPGRGTVVRFGHDEDNPDSLSASAVFSLYVDVSGALWVGTRGGGLDRLDSVPASPEDAVFRNYSEREGLANEVVYGILPDSVGRLWLSTNAGLSRLDPRTGEFVSFDASHGLQGHEFNFNGYFRSTEGELFFGGPNGFNAFFPERLQVNTTVPPVVLTAFLKFNRPVPDVGPLDRLERIPLGYRDDVVTFEFAALDYAAPGKNHYAYKLEGFDRDWIELAHVNRVTYTDLDAGRYVFRVRASNNHGTWNEEGLAVALDVAAPPWQTWWAYLAYILVLAGVVAGAVRAQRKKAAREAAYRRRLEVEVEARTVELGRQNTQLEALNSQLVETSFTDSLTGLRNRRFLFEEVNKEMSLVHRNHRELSRGLRESADELIFMMVDLDWFKPINDTCGHAAGDRVLVQVRHLLEKACRDSDTLIRWGGDEFLVVGRVNDLEGVEAAAERIRAVIEGASFDLGDGQVAHITCSIGFTCYPAGTAEMLGLSLEQVVGLADRALYSAKKAGRNAWVGLLGTPSTSVDRILETLQSDADADPGDGVFEVRRSADHQPAELAM